MKTGYTSMKIKLRRSVVHMTATRMAKTFLKKLDENQKMGTNYYWYSTNQCPTCHHIEAPLHIGKSSAGWAFGLRIHPEQDINTLDDWKKKWMTGEIKDEYSKVITAREMINVITNRAHIYGLKYRSDNQENSWLQISKGEGTFEYCNYEFS